MSMFQYKLVPDRTWNTTAASVAGFVNYLVVFYALSTLGERSEQGRFIWSGQIGTDYYYFAGLACVTALVGAYFIRYPQFSTRWGARMLMCALPAAFLVLLPFVWGG